MPRDYKVFLQDGGDAAVTIPLSSTTSSIAWGMRSTICSFRPLESLRCGTVSRRCHAYCRDAVLLGERLERCPRRLGPARFDVGQRFADRGHSLLPLDLRGSFRQPAIGGRP
jgi:hypothetical protein